MLEGYLSVIVILVITVLLLTGWRNLLFGSYSIRWIGLSFIAWFLLISYHVSVTGIELHLSVFIFIFWSICSLLQMKNKHVTIQTLAMSALAASLLVLYHQMTRIEPRFILLSLELDKAILLAIVLPLFSRNVHQQLPAITFALLWYELTLIGLHDADAIYSIGGPLFSDLWLLIYICTRGFTLCIDGLFQASSIFKQRIGRKE